ncbi:MAG: Flp family type IVb pilin [Alphaproteobacteria bacterium]|nr:Flp family type IVb pilin [Alphaproteobacteria bacterium]
MSFMVIEKMRSWVSSENGATAIEYGLIAAGISVAIAAVVWALGDDLLALFTQIETALAG